MLQYNFSWDLDNDGIYKDSHNKELEYTWDEDGLYFVSIRVFDGLSYAYDNATVNISNLPPEIYSTTYVYTLTQGTFTQTIPAVERAQDPTSFYNYYSVSAR